MTRIRNGTRHFITAVFLLLAGTGCSAVAEASGKCTREGKRKSECAAIAIALLAECRTQSCTILPAMMQTLCLVPSSDCSN